MHIANDTCLLNISEVNKAVALTYYQNDYIEKMTIERLEDHLYHIEGEIKIGYRLYHPRFCLDDRDRSISDPACDCHWFKKDDLCAHIGACIYLLSELDIDVFPFVYDKYKKPPKKTNLEAAPKSAEKKRYSFFETLALEDAKMRSRDLIDEVIKIQDLNIEKLFQDDVFYIVPNFELYYHELYLSFAIYNAQNDHYLIKNYHKLLNDIQNSKYVTYGKKISFLHVKEAFSKNSWRYLSFMQKVKDQNGTDDDREFPSYRYIKLKDDVLDLFYDYFIGDDVIEEVAMTFDVTITEEDFYYTIHLDCDEDLFFGNAHGFTLEDGILKHIENLDKVTVKLLRELEYEDLKVRIGEDMTAFLGSCIYPYRDVIKTVIPDDFRYDIDDIKIYADLYDEDHIAFEVIGYRKDGTKVNALSDQKYAQIFGVKAIKAVLDHFENSYTSKNKIVLDLDDENVISFVQNNLSKLNAYGEVYVAENLQKLGKKTRYKIQAGVHVRNDLLEFDLKTSDFDIAEIGKILNAYHRKKRFYRLKSGEMLKLESDEFKDLDALFSDLSLENEDIKNGKFKLASYRAFSLDKKIKDLDHITFKGEKNISDYIQGFNSLESPLSIDPKYDDVLRDYQRYGIKWLFTLYSYRLNGILADEMGLGKTIQALVLLDTIKKDDRHSLIVCPASLIYNWEDELNRFAKGLKYRLVLGNKKARQKAIKAYKECDVIITSYDYLRRDIDEYRDHHFEYVILDEAQNIKNQRTKNAMSVKELDSVHRLALSGTPIENSLAELWSIFDFLMPDYLYSYHYFKEHFENPIILNNDQKAKERLKELVSPFILRRTKKDVLKELPDKVDHAYLIDFKDEEKDLYLANLIQANKDIQLKLDASKIDHIAILAMLTRLRQLCLDPRLVYDDITTPSSKIEACVDLVKILCEHDKKVLIFSSFTTLIDLLAKEFDKEGLNYYVLTGQTSKEERRKLVRDYQSDDTPIFLISLKAGGTGLNLTRAEAVIHIDPWWNISAQDQATDRAHRIGQNANVQVYRLIMRDSIEEKIVKMQERKKDLADTFIEGNDGSLAHMSKEEIRRLFER